MAHLIFVGSFMHVVHIHPYTYTKKYSKFWKSQWLFITLNVKSKTSIISIPPNDSWSQPLSLSLLLHPNTGSSSHSSIHPYSLGRFFAFESPPVWKTSFLHVSRLASVLFLLSKLSTREGFSEHYLACCITYLFSLSPFTCLFFFLELDAGNRQLLSFNSEILSAETRAVISHNLQETKLWQIKLLSLIT